MSVTAISPQPFTAISPGRELRTDLKALGQALASDDLNQAQQAFIEFKQDVTRDHAAGLAPKSMAPDIHFDLRVLQGALKTGHLGLAKQAFAAFAADAQDTLRPTPSAETYPPTGRLNVTT
jgi:hypothetical protein